MLVSELVDVVVVGVVLTVLAPLSFSGDHATATMHADALKVLSAGITFCANLANFASLIAPSALIVSSQSCPSKANSCS